jgi:hypothetical protein
MDFFAPADAKLTSALADGAMSSASWWQGKTLENF